MARKLPPFMGKESKAEEASEKKKFPSKKAYAKAEAKFEGEKMSKFACGGKTKRYADGGGIPEGGKFDADTYARARKFVESGGQSEDIDTPAAKPSVRRVATTPAPKAVATPSSTPMAQYRPGTTTPADSDLPYANVGNRIFTGTDRKQPGSPASAVRAMRATKADDRYVSGGKVKKAASGGSVRGVGAAKRGFGRGKMC